MLEVVHIAELVQALKESERSSSAGTVARMMRCLESTGFLLVIDEAEETHTAFLNAAMELFRQPVAAKEQLLSTDRAKRGYSGYSTENFASLAGRAGPNDAVEKFRIGPELDPEELTAGASRREAREVMRFYFPNQWTGVSSDLRDLCLLHYRRMEELTITLLHVLERGLGIPEGFFADCMSLHTSIMTLNYYPPEELRSELRMAAHTDVSLLTILVQTPSSHGLEILAPSSHAAESWIAVPHVPGSYVVNIGDCLQHWTQGRLRSTFHRVVGSENGQAEERLSVGFFAAPKYNALLKSPWDSTDPGLTYNRWRDRRIRDAMQSLKEFENK